jgi:AraC-like DNA-binding protein
MTDTPFRYAESLCAEPLRRWLWNYWEFKVSAEARGRLPHHVPPDGCTVIMVASHRGQGKAMTSGPWLEPLVVPVAPGSHYWGVRCRPEAGALVLGTEPERLVNRTQPVMVFSPSLANEFQDAIPGVASYGDAVAAMDRIFAIHLRGVPEPDAVVQGAVNDLVAERGETSIGMLAARLDISARTLRRRFRAATGLTPKQFARICRFRAAAVTLVEQQRPEWARLASGAGFADQAHMIHEFKDLIGLTPEDLGAAVRRTSHGDLVV